MGSKGQSTQQTNNNQAYTADPRTQQAAGQALSGAETAAAQPFQMPVAPVAGFSNDQQGAFQAYRNAQGMAQPYFNQAANYTAQSAAPVTAADVNNVYNPMAANVTAQMQNIFGQQNVQNQGDLTAKAGGVGADRIAVGMSELANQQGLSAGQTYSNLYQQALQTAMQEKQLQAGAGGQFAAYGTGAQGAALQSAGAMNQFGNQEQAQQQAELNAPYQNYLAKIAYQFQTPQYLAGIAGGLAPALGGTTVGNQNTTSTPAQPSIAAQILGAGTAGVGLYNGLGSKGSGVTPNTDAINQSMNTLNTGSGGSYYGPGFAEGGQVDESPTIPGVTLPKAGGMEPIPTVSLPMGAGHSGPLTGGINFPQPQQQSGQGESVGGDIGQALKLATTILPFLKRGGNVPLYDDGGDVRDDPFNSDPVPSMSEIMSHMKASPGLLSQNIGGQTLDDSMFGGASAGKGWNLKDRFNSTFPQMGTSAPAPNSPPPQGRPPPEIKGSTSVINPDTPYRMPDVKSDGSPIAAPSIMREDSGREEEAPATTAGSRGKQAPSDISQYMLPRAQQPYPNALYQDRGQDVAKSPWMALIKAGATMMSTPGSLGTGIGKGILAGAGSLDSQRKELRSEQELNDKAQKLYQDAQVHLDKYNKMTPFEAGSLAARNREIDQAAESGTNADFKPAEITAAMRTVYEKPENIAKVQSTDPAAAMDLQRQVAAELARRKQLRTGQAATPVDTGPGSSHDNPIPIDPKAPGAAPPIPGKFYRFPDGSIHQWGA